MTLVDATLIRRGLIFRHARILDGGWRPGPGQRYVDGPKAEMIVTRVAHYRVYFRHHDGCGVASGGALYTTIDRFPNSVGEIVGVTRLPEED